jgi:hypothetical protein
MAVVLTLVQTKQIRINIHERNNTIKHITNNTNHSKYNTHITKTFTHPHIHTIFANMPESP